MKFIPIAEGRRVDSVLSLIHLSAEFVGLSCCMLYCVLLHLRGRNVLILLC